MSTETTEKSVSFAPSTEAQDNNDKSGARRHSSQDFSSEYSLPVHTPSHPFAVATDGKNEVVGLVPVASLQSGKRPTRKSVFGRCSFDSALGSHMSLRQSLEVSISASPADDMYETVRPLGCGAFGTCLLAEHKQTKDLVAIKLVTTTKQEHIDNEVKVAKKLNHPYVAKLIEVFVDAGEEDGNSIMRYWFVMEFFEGGNLNEYIERFRLELTYFNRRNMKDYTTRVATNGTKYVLNRGLDTRSCARFIWQMLSGITYLHQNNLIHRDIKAENYMIATRDDLSPIKLIDFGYAKFFETDKPIHGRVGTLYTMAPEVLQVKGGAGYSSKADIWSIGNVAYMCAVGIPPFEARTEKETIARITKGVAQYPDHLWARHPKFLLSLVQSLLSYKPEDRPRAEDVMKTCKWLQIERKATKSVFVRSCTIL